MKLYCSCGFTWFLALGVVVRVGHCHAKWPVSPHLNQLHQYDFLEVVHRAWLGHWSGGLAACSGEMVAAHWVEVVAIEASASGSSNVGLESSVAVSETESGALVLASAAGSFGVACKTG
jgi:hypothetical protein